MTDEQTVGDIAELVRSKNAGPFWITFDIFFRSLADLEHVNASQVLTKQTVGRLYHVDADDISIFLLPNLNAIKISFPRPTTQGDLLDHDMHAGQQHVPLAELKIPNIAD